MDPTLPSRSSNARSIVHPDEQRKLRTVKALLKVGADPSKKNNERHDALFFATKHKFTTIVEALKEAKVHKDHCCEFLH